MIYQIGLWLFSYKYKFYIKDIDSKELPDSKSNNDSKNKVSLSYRGNKHMNPKGKFAERGDVLYKSFIRASRRYLWMMFEKEFDVSKYRVRN